MSKVSAENVQENFGDEVDIQLSYRSAATDLYFALDVFLESSTTLKAQS